jgi:hypothetical protein
MYYSLLLYRSAWCKEIISISHEILATINSYSVALSSTEVSQDNHILFTASSSLKGIHYDAFVANDGKPIVIDDEDKGK